MKKNSKLHRNNVHKSGYKLDDLCVAYPELSPFVFENEFQNKTIDFSNPVAVKTLNKALLFKYYDIKYWDFPDSNLCPPIPGRVDYIHYIADLLRTSGITSKVHVLDIGTGATCIYPLLGYKYYAWRFVGTDIDKTSLKCAKEIIAKNNLSENLSLRFQKDSAHILEGVVNKVDEFSVTMCNPPFYKSEQEAQEATERKLKGLNKKGHQQVRNFSGKSNELWYKGGEKAFIHNYLYESTLFKDQCIWFTTLVSKKDLLKGIQDSLKKLGASKIKIIDMGQGNKISRIVAWTFQ
ncbi:23S rRNA (adenine(1618)-N(6))-methyltransferase RlmF [Algibacter mikhailovii]|uniref:23S rRNA (adenine(1618)-N(6))-methyltransferase RlmF n=1 Tax=Algibacter mikhailovii TaxID=425498 RepID=UPI001679546A|nr:23S rRNA (adenine(1618)-N(6))-methyltransferase RlmF [Algibacter mikhailovii]